MSYDENLAARIRGVLAKRTDVVEKKMFGGLCFMVGGAMCCGLTKTDFMVRVGPEGYDDALAQPHARPMDLTGKPLAGMVYVAPEGVRSAAALAKWIGRGVSYVSSLPPKAPRRSTSGSAAKKVPKSKGATHQAQASGKDPRVDKLLRTLSADPKLAPIVDAFEKTKPGAREFGSNGLKVDGKLFALFTQGTLVVKLPKDRVLALVASGVAEVLRLGLVEGVAVRAIAKRLHMARKTVRMILGRHRAPPRPAAEPRGSILDPYEAAIRAVLDDTPEMLAPAMLERLRPLASSRPTSTSSCSAPSVSARRSSPAPSDTSRAGRDTACAFNAPTPCCAPFDKAASTTHAKRRWSP